MQSGWPDYVQHPFATSDADIKFLIEGQPTEQLFSEGAPSAELSADFEGFEAGRRTRLARGGLTPQHSSSKEDLRSHAHQAASQHLFEPAEVSTAVRYGSCAAAVASAPSCRALLTQDANADPAALCGLPSLPLPLPSECGIPAPISAFHSHSQQSELASNLRITITQPSSDKAGPSCLLAPSSDMRPNSKLSTTPSDNIDTTCHMALRKRSSSLMTTSGDPEEDDDDDEDPVPMQRPLIQTGIHSGAARRGASDPPKASGGRRIVRTSEERKAHRMAKNRATAAASRKRKQAMKEELLQKADLLQMENAQLCELLKGRDAEIRHLRERLAVAEMVPPRIDAACSADQLPLFTGSPTF